MTGADSLGLRLDLPGLGWYGLAHALVDASCAALVYSAAASGRLTAGSALLAVVIYNLLAFAAQPLFGWFVNDSECARRWAQIGALLTACAFSVAVVPGLLWPAIVLTGVGNAIFHVGGGVASLLLERGKATGPGLFVAPGAAGLALGIWAGSTQTFAWLPAVALLAAIPLLRPLNEDPSPVEDSFATGVAATMALLLSVIALRAAIGTGLALPWKVEPALLVALTAAVVAGKAAGGLVADRFGHLRVGVGALVLSVPLLAVAPLSPVAGITGLLLFNVTMPVTLAAAARLIPRRPGFAFGLTCLALAAGSLPFIARVVAPQTGPTMAALTLVAATLLALALRPAAKTPGLMPSPVTEEPR